MTKERWQRIATVLDDVLDRPLDERAARLDALCPDAEFRADVEAFLAADAEAPDFLDSSAAAFAAPLLQPAPHEAPSPPLVDGSQVGPYRVVRELGRGGMGRVFLAERADGLFEQRVALKVLRGDVTDDRLRLRLRAERQILAHLNHPGIARVFDGGVTDDGRPYLVLEYVNGVPIDAYCEREGLGTRERLRLFEQVCAAVQYAHRNLVVHRDLKPSNILVTEGGEGTAPTVKLLDFGIAKLLEDAEANSDTAHSTPPTQTGERWMTPHYAAPEQVTGEAVTTSTDVYALGVLLYELLTGRRPFEDRPAHAVARAVVEADPPPPSAQAPEAALDPDLDTVVLKALRKEPARRYASAEALATDVRRYLDGLPVEARRATWRYRARKFAGRNRWPVAAAVAALLLLIGGGLWHNARVTAERDRAQAAALRAEQEAEKAEQVSSFLADLLQAGNPSLTAGDTLTAFDLLERGAAQLDTLGTQPAVQAEMAGIIGEAFAALGDFEQGLPLLERAVQLRRLDADTHPAALAGALEVLAGEFEDFRDFVASVKAYREALAIRRALPGREAALQTATTLKNLGGVLSHTDPDTGIVLAREALTLMESHGAPVYDLLIARSQLASTLDDLGRSAESVSLFEQALPGLREVAAADSSRLRLLSTVLHNYASTLIGLGRPNDAVPIAREALAIRQRTLDGAHQSIALSMRMLAVALSEAKRYDEARAMWEERLALVEQHLPPDHWRIGNAHTVLGSFDLWRGDPDRAEPHLRTAHAIFLQEWPNGTARWPDGHPWIEQALFRIGVFLALKGRYEDAEELLEEGAPGFDIPYYYGWNHYDDHVLETLLAHYDSIGRLERVAHYRAMVEDEE